jgi:large subunit ribosomal protein L29
MRVQELRELTREELVQKKRDLDDERFNLKMRKSFKELDDPLRLRHLRRDIARINTILREDDKGIRQLAQSKGSILDQADADTKENK